jgi:hypothetical protein
MEDRRCFDDQYEFSFANSHNQPSEYSGRHTVQALEVCVSLFHDYFLWCIIGIHGFGGGLTTSFRELFAR